MRSYLVSVNVSDLGLLSSYMYVQNMCMQAVNAPVRLHICDCISQLSIHAHMKATELRVFFIYITVVYNRAATGDFKHCGMCDQQNLRSA